MNKIFNYAIFTLILLNLSEGFRPLCVLLGIASSSTASTITLFLNIIYILANARYLHRLVRFKIFNAWLLLLVIYPVIAMIFSYFLGFLSLNKLFYWSSLNTMYSSLSIVSLIFALNAEYKTIKNLAILSIIVALIGFVVNYQLYSFSRQVLQFSNAGAAKQEELYRALSFFPNPNTAALSLIIYLILIFSTRDNKSYKLVYYVILLGVITGMIFLTGSRTSLILIAIIALFYLFPLLRNLLSTRYKFSKPISQLIILLSSAVIAVLFFGLLSVVSNFYTQFMSEEILDRMNFFSAFATGDQVQDLSLNYRTQIIPKYIKEIVENPLFGYGPEYVRNKISSGAFENVSQNAFIENAIIYGVPYSLFFLYCLAITFRQSLLVDKSIVKDKFNTLNAIIVFIFLISFSVNNLFWIRSVMIALGLILGSNLKTRLYTTDKYKISRSI